MINRRHRVACSVRAGFGVSALLVATSCGGLTVGLVDTSESFGSCQVATDEDYWQVMQRHPIAFGLDYLAVKGGKPVTITSVRLNGLKGGLEIVEASFVPGGGVGAGMRYDSGRQATLQSAWRARVSMPNAVLNPLHPSKEQLKEFPSSDNWQLVLGVVSTQEVGYAKGVTITYQVGRRRGTLTGRAAIGMAHWGAGRDEMEASV